jgi:glycosyltransferase involved in cell wall biosynthesis
VVLPPDRQTASLSYIVVTPAKDEARHIEKTLTSMLAQTHRPLQWVIVDDGSSDGTAEIVEKYAGVHDFIRLLRAERVTTRATGTAEVRAFLRGFELVRHETYDCIVKLDADLSFDRDYFEKLLTHFHADPRLGIASGVYLEAPEGGEWQEVTMPSYHAAGASKVIRRTCFEEIGGFIQERGWDTVDEIRAVARNWRTGHFTDLKMQHWKPEGTGMGRLRTSYMHGEIYCRTRGGALFFLMKTLRRLTWRPFIVGSLAMLWGYLHAFLRRREPLVTAAEGHRYRQLLTERMRARTRRFLPDL